MKTKNIILGLCLIILGIAIDQITKIIAVSKFKKGETYNGKIFNVTYTENTGGAFGMMSGKMWFLIIITVIAIGIFAYLMHFFNMKKYPIYSASLVLIIIGTLGNFIDRLFRHYVVDFIQFAFWTKFPVFNFADICISVGACFMVISILFGNGEIWKKSL